MKPAVEPRENDLEKRLEGILIKIEALNQDVDDILSEISDMQQNQLVQSTDSELNSITDDLKSLNIHGDQNENFLYQNGYVLVYIAGLVTRSGVGGIGIWFGYGNPVNVSNALERWITNNRVEITACIQALNILLAKQIVKVKIFTCNAFLANCIAKDWIGGWVQNNWKTRHGERVKNRDLLIKLVEIKGQFDDIQCHYIEHNVHYPEMEEARALAIGALP